MFFLHLNLYQNVYGGTKNDLKNTLCRFIE